MLSFHRVLLSACVLALAVPALAQTESELKDFFEGKSVIVKVDMPATQEGIDVFPDARRAIDFSQYSARLKSYGVAIKNGDSVMITKVRVKDKVIEFQLAGGGFGTFGDDTSSVYTPLVSKTKREKDLERLVKGEDDPVRKRRLQRELDDVRAERERADASNRAAAASASEVKKARIAADRLHSGSRFNLRYQNGVPPGLDPDGIMRALSEYVEFPFAGDPRPSPARAAQLAQPPRAAHPAQEPLSTVIRKGMSMADVEQALGKADKTSVRTDGSVRIVTAVFTRGDQVISADFIEDVLVKYSISSR
jgi:hypothetical protein